MVKVRMFYGIGIASTLLLSACQQPGQEIEANVYQASQVNQQQAAKMVTIMAVLQAKVAVDNRANQQTAQVAGALFGALAGGLLGHALGQGGGPAAIYGASAGTVAGLAGGAMVPATALVDGVTITYRDDSGKIFSSTQVGEACQFVPGQALIISTGPGETRIQPDAVCPKPSHA